MIRTIRRTHFQVGDVVKYNRKDGGDFDFSIRVEEISQEKFSGQIISSTTSSFSVGRKSGWNRNCFRWFDVAEAE